MFVHLVQLGRVGYGEGLEVQRRVVEARKAGRIGDTLLLLEHPAVITLGRNSRREHVLMSDAWLAARGVELHEVNRGGDVTYHGPGQLVGYPIVDLRGEWPGKKGPFLGPVDFVRMLEEALIRVCGEFGVMAGRVKGATGVWVAGAGSSQSSVVSSQEEQEQKQEQMGVGTFGGGDPALAEPGRGTRGSSQFSVVSSQEEQEQKQEQNAGVPSTGSGQASPLPLRYAQGTVEMTAARDGEGGSGREDASAREGGGGRKLAAIGVHVSQGVTSHGFALNVTTDLREFEWIVPCGIRDRGVTSLEAEAAGEVTMEAARNAVARQFGRVFGRQMVACGSVEELVG